MRTLLIYPFVILIVVAVGLTGFLSLYYSGRTAEHMAWQLMDEISARIEARVIGFLNTAHLVNEINANAIASGLIDLKNMGEQESFFWRQVKAFDYISYSYVGLAEGGFIGARRLADGTLQTIATETLRGGEIRYFNTDNRGFPTTISSSLPYYDHRTRPWYKAGIEAKKPTWSPVFVDAGGEGLTVTATTPLYDDAKAIKGVLGCSFIFSRINQFLRGLKIGESGLTFIMERSGMLVATSTSDATYTDDKKRIAPSESGNPKISRAGGYIAEQIGDPGNIDRKQRLFIHVQGEKNFVQLSPLKDHRGIDWLVVLIIPENDFMSHIRSGNINTILLSLVALCATTAVGFAIARRITRPILELNVAARSLAGGDWSQELKIDRRDEVGELTRSFNLMVKNLQVTTVSRDCLAEEMEERKKIESELQKLAAVVEHSSELVTLADLEGGMIFINEAGATMLGVLPGEAGNHRILEFIPDDLKAMVENKVFPTVFGKGRWEGELRYRNLQTGCVIDAQAMVFTIRDVAGEPLYLANVSRDVTDCKRAEEDLRDNEELLKSIIQGYPVPSFMIGKDHRVIHWNRALEEFTGLPASAVIGTQEHWRAFYRVERPCMADLLVDEDREAVLHWYDRNAEKSGVLNEAYEATQFFPDLGESGKWLRFTAAAVRNSRGVIVGAIETLEDITGRKLAEEKYRSIFENAMEGIYQTTLDGRFISVNPAFAHMLGYDSPEEVLHAISDISRQVYANPKHRVELLRLLMQQGKVFRYESQFRRKDGSIAWFTINIRVVRDKTGQVGYLEGTAQDISERKTLEARLVQVQKMEAIGTLAGGIAHDFNNILAPIIGYSELALREIPRDTRLHRNMEQVLRSGARAKDLVKQILTFSRKTEQERKPVQVSLLVEETCQMLRSTLPTTIEIRRNIDGSASDSTVMADPTQIHQVLMNLCTNAAHAMREKGGVLSIDLAEVHIESAAGVDFPDLEAGSYLRLAVSDTGYGMSGEVRERIFDPYFTTKGPDEGTGLGLAVVYGIVKDLSGGITVSSNPGEGSTFELYFPTTKVDTADSETTPEGLPTGKGHILVVDDEQFVAEMLKEMLERLGYEVTVRYSSAAALGAFQALPHRFDLVITDQTMPHLTGTDLAKEIFKVRPGVPIVLCTGFSVIIDEARARRIGIKAFLMKPVAMQQLAREVHRLLKTEG